jgi:hypothetical protein
MNYLDPHHHHHHPSPFPSLLFNQTIDFRRGSFLPFNFFASPSNFPNAREMQLTIRSPPRGIVLIRRETQAFLASPARRQYLCRCCFVIGVSPWKSGVESWEAEAWGLEAWEILVWRVKINGEGIIVYRI